MAALAYKLNWQRDRKDPRDHEAPLLKAFRAPPVIDLRKGVHAIYDQGELGSCTAQMMAYILQFIESRQNGTPAPIPSRLFIYWVTRWLQGTLDEDSGATIRNVFRAVAKEGYPPEHLWRYIIANFKKRPPKAAFEAGDWNTLDGSEHARVPHNLPSIQFQLSQGNPIGFGFDVPESFMDARTARTGIVRKPRSSERDVGGHAMTLVGYDNPRRVFFGLQSWGRRWGQGGFCEFPFDFILDQNRCADFRCVLQLIDG